VCSLASPIKKPRRMSGLTLIVLLMVTVVAAGGLTIASIYLNGSSTKTASLLGVVTIYTTAENSASYNASLNAKSGDGTLSLTQVKGSTDPITVHTYDLSNVLISPYNITMTISGANVSLGWVTTSTMWSALNDSYGSESGIASSHIWNDLNSSYVAASGPGSAANQTIGHFSPSVFQLSNDYNLFIGLTIPTQPPFTVPIVIAQIRSVEP
jgi:hypothetical protein